MKKLLIGLILLIAFFFLFKEKSGPVVSQNGISISKLANDIVHKYDVNSNKVLDVTKESFLRTEIDNVRKTESRGLLFTDVDKFGNSDGSVSLTELQNYLRKFDTDSDGKITSYKNIFDSIFGGKSEWFEFDRFFMILCGELLYFS